MYIAFILFYFFGFEVGVNRHCSRSVAELAKRECSKSV
jgi:hypothetical protein